MAIFGAILLIIGVVLFFVQRNYSTKLRSIQSAIPATVAELQKIASEIAAEIGSGNLREYVKVRGLIRSDRPLLSELKQQPCVHYTMRVVREYEEKTQTKDSEGRTKIETRKSSETVSNNSRSIPFLLEDRSGQILVNPDGGNIDTEQILDEFRHGDSTSISFGGFTMSFGNSFGVGDRRTLGYRYTESILPCDREVLVIGTAADDGGNVTLRKPIQSDKKFIISLKSEEALAKSTANAAKGFFYGMVGCLAIGSVLLILGLILKK